MITNNFFSNPSIYWQTLVQNIWQRKEESAHFGGWDCRCAVAPMDIREYSGDLLIERNMSRKIIKQEQVGEYTFRSSVKMKISKAQYFRWLRALFLSHTQKNPKIIYPQKARWTCSRINSGLGFLLVLIPGGCFVVHEQNWLTYLCFSPELRKS